MTRTRCALRHPRARTGIAAGFTLLEIIVTLVVLGLAAAIVAPAFDRAKPPAADPGRVVAQAREIAVRRAQAMRLVIDTSGAWEITPAGATTVLARGTLPRVRAGLALRITPLGACFAEGESGIEGLDTMACTLNGAKGNRQ